MCRWSRLLLSLLTAALLATVAPLAPVRAVVPAPISDLHVVVLLEEGAPTPTPAGLGVAQLQTDGEQLVATPRAGETPRAAARRIAARHDVAGAYVDAVARTTAAGTCSISDPTCNFAAAGYSWSLGSTATSGIRASGAWSMTRGDADVVVAIVDTGIAAHPDLPTPVGGYDFFDFDTDPSDPGDFGTCGIFTYGSSWHGTHVAGTIAATADNGAGIDGVASGISLLDLRALGACGGSFTDITDSIRWAAGLSTDLYNDPWSARGIPENTRPADVINLSLGAWGYFCNEFTYTEGGVTTLYLQSAIDEARAAGAVVVAAAGNNISDAALFVPANCAGVISVGSVGRDGELAAYANRGGAVDISAPGGYLRDIDGDGDKDAADAYATMILSTYNAGTTTPGAASMGWLQGTSMAAPHVAGVAALLRSLNPSLTPDEIETALVNTARAFPNVEGDLVGCTVALCGAGMLDASAAVASLLTSQAFEHNLPGVVHLADGPIVIAASATGGGAVTVTSEDTFVCSVAGPTLTPRMPGTCSLRLDAPAAGIYTASSTTVSVMIGPAGTALTASVVINGGAVSTNNRTVAISLGFPDGVAIATLTVAGSDPIVVRLPWSGELTLPAAVGTYTVNARFEGPAFESLERSASITLVPPSVPGIIRSLVVIPGSKRATLAFGAPLSDGGSTITDYTVQYRRVGTTSWRTFTDGVRNTTGATVTGLLNGYSYEFRVRAVNAAGSGPVSTGRSVRVGAPTAPRSPVATRVTSASVRISWAAPVTSNGASIIGYRIAYRRIGTTTWRYLYDSTPATRYLRIGSLAVGARYEFMVSARNSRGYGPYSSLVTYTAR